MTSTQLLAVLIVACLPSVCRADSAEQILAETGVRGGLVVHLGCGDGASLFSSDSESGYNCPPDVFLVDGLLWMYRRKMIGVDPATGEVKKEIPTVPGYMHHRCYRNKATDNLVVPGIQGVQFVDLHSGEVWPNHWIRGTCQYGIVSANGLLYVAPDSCRRPGVRATRSNPDSPDSP